MIRLIFKIKHREAAFLASKIAFATVFAWVGLKAFDIDYGAVDVGVVACITFCLITLLEV